ncbi:hypothetical protein R3P38DRAFT_3180630 [Favolaschia claudopus]|uniref:Uncharacterized protein n=1 Tax=Favolaschia claudopus TaxID=2862362 RepID=A0AAW0CR14_9AGAR
MVERRTEKDRQSVTDISLINFSMGKPIFSPLLSLLIAHVSSAGSAYLPQFDSTYSTTGAEIGNKRQLAYPRAVAASQGRKDGSEKFTTLQSHGSVDRAPIQTIQKPFNVAPSQIRLLYEHPTMSTASDRVYIT